MAKVFQRVDNTLEQVAVGGISPAEAELLEQKIDSVQETADAALPITGGEMTGPINCIAENIDLEVVENKTQDCYTPFFLKDKNGHDIVNLTTWYWQTTSWLNVPCVQTALEAHMLKEDGSYVTCGLSLGAQKDGTTSVSAPHPRADNYGSDIVTTQALKDYAPHKFMSDIIFHIGGANASDTADLFRGRGESAELPFASLGGAVRFFNTNYFGNYFATFILHSDITWNEVGLFYFRSANRYTFKSDEVKRNLTLGYGFDVRNGSLKLENIKITTNAARFLLANGTDGSAGTVIIGEGVEFAGSATEAVINASYGGTVIFNSAISGNVTGRKYNANKAGRIFTNNITNPIPGTIEGTCDANSIYA